MNIEMRRLWRKIERYPGGDQAFRSMILCDEKKANEAFYDGISRLYDCCKLNKDWSMCDHLLTKYNDLYRHDDYRIICELIGYVDESKYVSNRTEEDNKYSMILLKNIVDDHYLTRDDLLDQYKTGDKEEKQSILCIIKELHQTYKLKDKENLILNIFEIDDWIEFYNRFT